MKYAIRARLVSYQRCISIIASSIVFPMSDDVDTAYRTVIASGREEARIRVRLVV